MWLPVQGLISADTYFLQSTPYNTVTAPGDSVRSITATAYQYRDNSLFYQAGRGFTPDNQVTPDLAAPGVNLLIPLRGGGFGTRFREQPGSSHHRGGSSSDAGVGHCQRKYPLCIGKYCKICSAERGRQG